MRNAQKNAMLALLAAMAEAKEIDAKRAPKLPDVAADKAIQLDPFWLITRGPKGRA